jgi:hypothetical protein
MAFMMTKGKVEDFAAWKAIFDQDPPGARSEASGYRVYQGADDPNEVVVQVEFPSLEKARAGRERLVSSGVLDRLPEVSGPTILEEAESVAL